MRIQLKQNEIEEAIKGFLNRQGIHVKGKAVEMAFTSGRKNNGLSVEVMIEDEALPPLSEPCVVILDNLEEFVDCPTDPEATTEAPPTEEVKPAGSLFG